MSDALTPEDLDRLAGLAGLTIPAADRPLVAAGLQAQIALVADLIEPALDRAVPGSASDPRRYAES